MELGATVCTPRAPSCTECPLRPRCAAFAAGEPERYPVPRTRRATEHHGLLAALVERRGRFLFLRRAESASLLGGTWEVPWVAAGHPVPAEALSERYGGRFALGRRCGEVRHSITFRALSIEVFRAGFTGRLSTDIDAAWHSADELSRLPHSSLVQKILRRAATGAAPAGGARD